MPPTSETTVGRDAELKDLASLLGVVSASGDSDGGDSAGESGIVLLSGDAGVGKTRLLGELSARVRESGWQVFSCQCVDLGDSELPYLPFSELLGQLAAELPDVVDSVTEVHPALARLEPGRRMLSAGGRREDAVPDSPLDRADLFDSVRGLIEAAAEKAPFLLLVEDIHWADQSTRDLLGFLFTRPFAGRVSLVASYRSDDVHRRHPMRPQVAEWGRLPRVGRMQLAPLSGSAVRALVRELVTDPLDDVHLADIVHRAEGNAFFVEELVASDIERAIPDDLADLLLVRLDRLDEAARMVAQVASVAGREVSHGLLAAASGLSRDLLDRGIRKAVDLNILNAGSGSYSFRHALLAEAVYQDVLPGERVRLHAQYAAALAEGTASGTAAELALHAHRSDDLGTALTASIEAGDEAMRVGGPGEAAHHYERALELAADHDPADLDVAALAVKSSAALAASGDFEHAADVLREQLERLPDDSPPTWQPHLLSAYANALMMIETDVNPVEVSAEAVALAPQGETKVRAKVLADHARILDASGRADEAEPFGIDALAMAERLDMPVLASEIITTLSGLKRADSRDSVRSSLVEAVDRAQGAGAVQAELRARFHLGRLHQSTAEWPEAQHWFRSAMEIGDRAGQTWAPYCLESRWQLALIMHQLGEWDGVLQATSVVESDDARPLPRALLQPVALAVRFGRGEDVGDQLRDLRRYWEREGGVAIHAADLEIRSAGRDGNAKAAVATYDEAVTVVGRIWHEWFDARVRLAAGTLDAICRAVPQVPVAERAALRRIIDRVHADGASVVAHHSDAVGFGFWGVEGRAWLKRLDAETLRARWLVAGDAVPSLDDLLGTWREAEQLFEALGHVPELAQVRATLSGIMRLTGDPVGARALGDAAREVAHRLGAQPLLDDLRTVGSAPAPAASSDVLTARETEILALVADGRSNGEIAGQLFISAKTVSVHVSNILGKLGASGRTEAAATARQRGLLD